MKRLTLEDLPAGHVCTYAHWQYRDHVEEPALHTHDFLELFWVEEGDGFQVVNDDRRPLAAGTLCLVRAEDRHGFSAARPGATLRFVNFAFPLGLWRELWIRRLDRRPAYFEEKDHRKREWRLPPEEIGRLRAMARDLAAGARDALSAEALLVGVISLLSALESRQAAGRLPSWLSAALARIQEPRHFARGTAELARLADCSPEHLSRAVRKHLGRTPTEIINDARLAYAAQQLCTTARPVADIAKDCGLGNLGHFYKLFRARFGTSPERYRTHAYTG